MVWIEFFFFRLSGKHERNVCFLLGFSGVLWGQISLTRDWLQIAAAVQKQLVYFCVALIANKMLCAQCPTCHAWNIQYAWIAMCCHSCGQVSRISARVVSRGLFFLIAAAMGDIMGLAKLTDLLLCLFVHCLPHPSNSWDHRWCVPRVRSFDFFEERARILGWLTFGRCCSIDLFCSVK